MPRNPSGTYTYPTGTRGSAGTPIESLKYNNYIDDVALTLNTPLPITAGGTGGATSSDAMNNLGGELAKQIVTNYDSFPFQSGSFYSAADPANGAHAPTVNAFIGICYTTATTGTPPTSADMFIEARDQVTGILWLRQKKAGIWQPFVNTNPVIVTPPGTPGVPPPSAPDSAFWWDETRGKLFYRYNDGAGTPSTQWVEAVATADIDPNLFVEISGDTMTGFLSLSANATSPMHAVPKQQFDAAVAQLSTSIRGYLSGLTLSSGGGSQTFGVATGVAMDFASSGIMTTPSISKSANNWTVGNNGGSLDSGGPVTPSTWYHVFIIRRPDTGVVDICTSVSTIPNIGINIPAAYTQYRRIGSMKTDGSSNWTAFSQNGDEFLWTVTAADIVGAAIATTSLALTLSVPFGVQVSALMRVGTLSTTTVPAFIYVSSFDESAQAAGANNRSIGTQVTGMGGYSAIAPVRTNTLSQVRVVGTAVSGQTYWVGTYGWIDRRGRDQ